MIKKILLTFLMVFLLAGVSLAETVTITWTSPSDRSSFDTIRVMQSTSSDDGTSWNEWVILKTENSDAFESVFQIPSDDLCYKWHIVGHNSVNGNIGNASNEARACLDSGVVTYPTIPDLQIMTLTITP